MTYQKSVSRGPHGFTLMELMTVMVLMAMLFALSFPAMSFMRGKAERAKCVNNLHALYAAGTAYVTDYNSWPQVDTDELENPAYAQAWIDAFTPYHLTRINWICPTIQNQLGDPAYGDNEHARIDYIPTPFDTTPRSPMRWPHHPWFIERGDMHGDGNLIIFANGQIETMNEVKKNAKELPQTSN
jgi:prepilin-type N-terminal cleavage/methylation domain-containing protein